MSINSVLIICGLLSQEIEETWSLWCLMMMVSAALMGKNASDDIATIS